MLMIIDQAQVLPLFSKIFEKLELNKITNLQESNIFMVNEQFGFRK